MDTTQMLLILMPLAIGLQTFWIAHAINSLRGDVNARFDGVNARFDGVEGRLDNVEGRLDNVGNRLDRLQHELHAHELGCQKRNEAVEVRLDRLER